MYQERMFLLPAASTRGREIDLVIAVVVVRLRAQGPPISQKNPQFRTPKPENQNPASASAKVLLKSTRFDTCGCSTISCIMKVLQGYYGTVLVLWYHKGTVAFKASAAMIP